MSSIVLRLATHVIHDIYIRVFSNAANDILKCLLIHCNAYCDKITNSIFNHTNVQKIFSSTPIVM